MKLRIEDIAKMANVSKATVSLALNDKPGISNDTREKVLNIAKEAGYFSRPAPKPDSSYPPTKKVIEFVACVNSGIVVEQYQNRPFFTELIHYIQEHLRSKEYSILFSSVRNDQFYEEMERVVKNNASDGMIVLGTNLTYEQLKYVAELQPNLVVLDTCFETLNVNFVDMNNVYGAYCAAQYLIEQGHRDIGYVQADSRIYNFDMRKKGFLQALEEHGLMLSEENCFSMSANTITSQDKFKEQVLKQRDKLPTALFCECDYLAISTIKSLSELDIHVPAEISVIGFDNITESQIISPELTTIHVDKEKMASVAVDQLIQIIEGKAGSRSKTLIDTELVERASCTSPLR
ncbi:LacI family DNA-binding transcriptional regulator [Ectobacillus ponti]|uniref:LacI family DNA-binding transcriptional regulator n=1 Tax=Ectobacillus ponti TaxID=2961894 RepID=A0AA42BNV6_9BACI|nr:LacI family DNA-binding transcriptional regulator [Ectobacillus ponti]MCP8967751.1 LacI family DNA-binding transcriptional regulator [Ectobacillus ponti]